MTQYSITEARNRFDHLIHRVEAGETVEIMRQGQRVAVLISADEYDRKQSISRKVLEPQKDFWTATLEWRKKYDVDNWETNAGEMTDEEFDRFIDGLRDRSPGRDV